MTSASHTIATEAGDITFTADPATVAEAGAAVAFMRGQLKAEGDTGAILDALRSGAADAAFVTPSD